jgi:hypothetical protein
MEEASSVRQSSGDRSRECRILTRVALASSLTTKARPPACMAVSRLRSSSGSDVLQDCVRIMGVIRDCHGLTTFVRTSICGAEVFAPTPRHHRLQLQNYTDLCNRCLSGPGKFHRVHLWLWENVDHVGNAENRYSLQHQTGSGIDRD